MSYYVLCGVLVLGLVSVTSSLYMQRESGGYEGGVTINVVRDGVEHTRESFNERITKNFNPYYTWAISDDGIVRIPFKYTSNDLNMAFMKTAFQEWEKDTCVRFQQIDAADTRVGNHLRIYVGKTWCLADLGPYPHMPSNVSMYAVCKLSGYVHEMGHALGMEHEHVRSDRDEFVQLKWDNLKESEKKWYKKEKTKNFGTEFDYTSVMLYPPFSDSKNGRQVLVPTRYPLWGNSFGYPPRASYMNTKLINKALNCDKAFLKKCSLSEDPCQNGGYMGGECKCLCPPGTEGQKCEDKKMDYSDALLAKEKPYSKILTTPGLVTSPNYPNTPKKKFDSLQILKAPKCKRVVITMLEDLDLIHRDDKKKCEWDRLRIGSGIDAENFKDFCLNELKKGAKIQTGGGDVYVFFNFWGWEKKGFKASWELEDMPGCS